MSFPRYGSYKRSGMDWLGEVPRHWELPKLKQFAAFAGGGTPSRDRPELWNGDVPWVSPKDMKAEALNDSEEHLTEAGLSESTANLVPSGSVLLVVRSGILKHTIPVAVNTVPVALNQDMKAILFEPERCLPWFFLRWVQGFNDTLINVLCKQGATVESIEYDYLRMVQLPLPPLSEQAAITAFLDRETAKIDALVEEQRRLIALLAEKRQAVISHAVTKGLDPNVPMKDSGVEWLGEVPAHWQIKRLKQVVRPDSSITYGIVQAGPHVEGGVPYIKTGDMAGDELPREGYALTSVEVSESYRRSQLEKGDLVVAIRATVGKCLPIPDELIGANLTQGTAKISPGAEIMRDFLLRIMQSIALEGYFECFSKGATFKEITLDVLRRAPVPQPPLEEQVMIVAWLSDQIEYLNNLRAASETSITFLQERRAALISAAVTGQIDVRGLVPTVEEAA